MDSTVSKTTVFILLHLLEYEKLTYMLVKNKQYIETKYVPWINADITDYGFHNTMFVHKIRCHGT